MIEEYILSFARVYGALLLFPFSAFGISEPKRIALVIMLAWVVGPREFHFEFIILEFVIGMMVAFPSMLLIDFFVQAAEIFDASRGASMDVIYSPNTQHHEHSLQQIVRVCGVTVYFSSGAVGTLLSGLIQIPTIQVLTFTHLGQVLMYTVQEVSVGLICLVLPFAFASAFIEFVIGWGVKAVPNLSSSNESFFMRLLAGVFFLKFAASAQSIDGIKELFVSTTKMGVNVLSALSGGV